ncbi:MULTISPECIES: porin family protein [Hymenobacter]|uniref:Outer membrane protein beta-barrel domain-containing protein n=1 Tax=Hymenobacter mucosus TaxID=1411120 RepID=A0A239B6T5_9BACT|nr:MULTISPECIES: porin family protein [Hymenobacter]SNS02884.1 Outer membrane protein beta-barrel domain-containing protein [Hymenobacter mucosus]
MKKKLLTAAVLLTVAAASSAQAQGVRLGLRAGANYSNLAGNVRNENTYNNKLGLLGGVMLNADVTGDGFFSIQPEVLYSQKGFENKPTEYTNLIGAKQKREGKVNYNYLDVPVLLKVNAGGFIVEAGPQYSYLLSANNETRTTTYPALGGSPRTSETQNKKDLDGLNRSELGYVAGIGYQADNGVSLNLRYTGAFSDFVKGDNGTYFDGDLQNARHSAVQLSLGYLIPSK